MKFDIKDPSSSRMTKAIQCLQRESEQRNKDRLCFTNQLALDIYDPIKHLMGGYADTMASFILEPQNITRANNAIDHLKAALSAARRNVIFTNLVAVDEALIMLKNGSRDSPALQKKLDSAVRYFDDSVKRFPFPPCENK